MTGVSLRLLLGVLVGTAVYAQAPGPGGRPAGPVLFEGARLITGDDGAPIESAAFLVENGRFTAAGRKGDVRAPAGAARIDLTGKTVIPALVNAHVHIGFQQGHTFATANYVRDNILDQLNKYAYGGVAAVLSLGTDAGDLPYEIRTAQQTGRAGGALFRVAGRGLAPPDAGPANAAMKSSAYGVTTEQEARAAVREQVERGADLIKIWVDDRNGTVQKLAPALSRAIIDEAHARNKTVVAHIFYLADAKALAREGVDGFAHLPRDADVDEELVGLMKRGNVFQIPNTSGSENGVQASPPAWLDDPLLRAVVPPAQVARMRATYAKRTPEALARSRQTYERMQRSLATLAKAGIHIGFGTDAGAGIDSAHGFADHRELQIMVQAGMSPMQALVAATRTSAEIVGLGQQLGTVAPGKSADFVVLDANPLDDITNTRKITTVYLRGAEVDRTALRSAWTASTGGQP